MNLKIKQDYCILVNNYSDWIDIQKYLFSINFQWMGFKNKLFKKYYTGNKHEDIIFPRYLVINFFNDERAWAMYNTPNYEIQHITKPNDGPLIMASSILRKQKLQKIETSK